jgi:hypothetical protein
MGGAALVAFFLLGVVGPASFPLGTFSSEGFFLFLLIFATLGRDIPFARFESSLALGEALLNRADLLDDILYSLERNCGFSTSITAFCLSSKGHCSLKSDVRRAAVF